MKRKSKRCWHDTLWTYLCVRFCSASSSLWDKNRKIRQIFILCYLVQVFFVFIIQDRDQGVTHRERQMIRERKEMYSFFRMLLMRYYCPLMLVWDISTDGHILFHYTNGYANKFSHILSVLFAVVVIYDIKLDILACLLGYYLPKSTSTIKSEHNSR